MKQELINACFTRGWRCFCFDHGASHVILDNDNYCIQINMNALDTCFLIKLRTASLRNLASEFKK